MLASQHRCPSRIRFCDWQSVILPSMHRYGRITSWPRSKARSSNPEILKPFGMECLNAQDFLLHQYHLDPDSFITVLGEQAKHTNRSLAELVALLSKYTPKLAELIKA